MWTATRIETLKKWLEYTEVQYRDQKVYGMDLVPPEDAVFYLEEYDHARPARPDGVTISETDPNDFTVYLRIPKHMRRTNKQPKGYTT
jgi:hypothetical protein